MEKMVQLRKERADIVEDEYNPEEAPAEGSGEEEDNNYVFGGEN